MYSTGRCWCSTAVDGQNLPQQILWALVLGGTILAAYALIDFVDRGGTWRDRFVRAQAFGSDYNWLSTYMVMTIPVIGSLIVITRLDLDSRRFPIGSWPRGRIAQVFSYTRGGWLGHAAQAVTLALMIGGRRMAMAVLGSYRRGRRLVVMSQVGIQTDTVAAKTVDTRLKVWGIGLGRWPRIPSWALGTGTIRSLRSFPNIHWWSRPGFPIRNASFQPCTTLFSWWRWEADSLPC